MPFAFRRLLLPALLLGLFSSAACIIHLRHDQYMAVAPGMTQQEVMATLQEQPTAFFEHGMGYVAWQYGEQYCVLFKDNVVVSKNMAQYSTENTSSHRGERTTTTTIPAHCPLPQLLPVHVEPQQVHEEPQQVHVEPQQAQPPAHVE